MKSAQSGFRRPPVLFLLLCVVCILSVLVFGFLAVRRSHPKAIASLPVVPKASVDPLAGHAAVQPATGAKALDIVPMSRLPAKVAEAKSEARFLYFEANALGDNYGKLAVAALDNLDRAQYSTDLSCDRVHFSGGKGICLGSDRGVFTTYSATMFDARMKRGWSIPLNGVPSRTRVSPSGRLGAITIFLSGHSYTSLNFSTQTTIMKMATGNAIANLETFSVVRDGRPFQSPDFNFWGVTFQHDENKFYATLWSKGQTYLVAGNLTERNATVIHDGVECPSLSPDNTRIAFKKRVEGEWRVRWHLYILDLKTMSETPLAEMRSVDDQVEWLDDQRILYSLSEQEQGSSASTDVWVSPATAGGVPHILRKGTFSPAIH